MPIGVKVVYLKRHLRQQNFSKGLTKLAIPTNYKSPGMLYLACRLAYGEVPKLEFSTSKII